MDLNCGECIAVVITAANTDHINSCFGQKPNCSDLSPDYNCSPDTIVDSNSLNIRIRGGCYSTYHSLSCNYSFLIINL